MLSEFPYPLDMEGAHMQIGQIVKVLDAFENEQDRRVVSFDFRNVYVCRDEEWKAARAAKQAAN